TVPLGDAGGLKATFTDGSGTWDNNAGRNYDLGTGNITVQDGTVAHSDPCADAGPEEPEEPDGPNTASVYYATSTVGWSTVNLHYRPHGGAWTAVPGIGMEAACTGWVKRTVDLGSATGLQAAFNNGNGVWDNNNGSDYTLAAGLTTVKDRTVTASAEDPCAAEEPDTEAPSAPTSVKAAADGVAVVVTWEPATDDRGVTKYQVTRTGGTKGTVVTDTTSTVFSDTGLEARTAYRYTVRAVDAAGNVSADSAPASVTTGEKPTAPATGTPLGTDPRKDPIYFVLTARFNDGDPTNNRGGSQHEKSGNAANDDPMFRGDFKGLVQKLDYIKGLGFSAIWTHPGRAQPLGLRLPRLPRLRLLQGRPAAGVRRSLLPGPHRRGPRQGHEDLPGRRPQPLLAVGRQGPVHPEGVRRARRAVELVLRREERRVHLRRPDRRAQV
ncbi:Alpha amylase, catalytic domain, partial [Streptomyces sp. Ncost-T6T-2b]